MTFLHKYLRIWGLHGFARGNARAEDQLTLKDVPPGHKACVAGFSLLLSAERRALLRAYGLVPGYLIRVMQHSPVSIIQVEHTEIALEPELASEIFIMEI